MGRREQRLRQAARQRSSDSARERVRQSDRLEGRVRRRPSSDTVPWWGRVIGGVLLAGVLALVGFTLPIVDANSASWAQHVTLEAGLLTYFGGFFGMFVSERVTRAVFVAVGWVFPVATAWLAIEMWNDWRAFRSHGSRVSLDSQADARVTAVVVVGLGLAALWFWVTVVRGRRGSRRRAAGSSLG